MEIKIGVQHAPREIVFDTNQAAADIEASFAAAVAGLGLFSVEDVRGRKVLIPADKIAYVEIGGGAHGQVGFRS